MRVSGLPVVAVSMLASAAMSLGAAPATAAPVAPVVHAAPHHAAYNRGNGDTRADLFLLVTNEETYDTDTDRYGSFTQLTRDGIPMTMYRGVQLRIVHVNGSNGFCLRAEQGADGYRVWWDSAGGGFLHKPCPVTTSGRSGGTRAGAPPGRLAAVIRDLAQGEEQFLAGHPSGYGSARQLLRHGDAPTLPGHFRLQVSWYAGSTAYCLRGTERTSVGWYDSRTGKHRSGCGHRPKGAKAGGGY